MLTANYKTCSWVVYLKSWKFMTYTIDTCNKIIYSIWEKKIFNAILNKQNIIFCFFFFFLDSYMKKEYLQRFKIHTNSLKKKPYWSCYCSRTRIALTYRIIYKFHEIGLLASSYYSCEFALRFDHVQHQLIIVDMISSYHYDLLGAGCGHVIKQLVSIDYFLLNVYCSMQTTMFQLSIYYVLYRL